MVSSMLDYSLLYGVHKKYIDRIQIVRNCLCRIVTMAVFNPVSHKLKELHILSVKYRIIFKLNIVTDKVLSLSEAR